MKAKTNKQSAKKLGLQRGDVVDVSLNDGAFMYRGIVRSASKRNGIHVMNRNSGATYRIGSVASRITLAQRLGLMNFNKIYEVAQRLGIAQPA